MTEPANSSLKWGFSSMGAPEMTLAALAALAARLECPHIELRTLRDTIDLPRVLGEDYAVPAQARAAAASRGVQVICLNSSFKLTDGGEKEREELANFATWADHLEAPFIRVFGGGKWGEEIDAGKWATLRDNVAWWRRAKKEAGWRSEIILETHDAFSGSPQCLELFEKIGSELPIIWDSHHTWKLGGEAPAKTWAEIGRHIKHVHLKDSISRPSARHPYTYVHIGEGEFPWQETISLLLANNYSGVVSIEWEKLWHPYLDPLEKALEKAREKGLW